MWILTYATNGPVRILCYLQLITNGSDKMDKGRHVLEKDQTQSSLRIPSVSVHRRKIGQTVSPMILGVDTQCLQGRVIPKVGGRFNA